MGRSGPTLSRWLLAALAACAVLAVGYGAGGQSLGLADTTLHAGAWSVLGALVAAALGRTRPDLSAGRRGLAAIAIVVAFGALDELAQTWAPLRSAQWGDLLADAVGGTLGVSLHAVVSWGRRRAQPTA